MTASPLRSMPPLSDVELAHSQAVAQLIGAALEQAGGWLSFERFMELALYAPALGYYSAGSAKLGAGGDFVTAPEVSDLFGRCLARQCAAVLAVTGGEVLELGAGSGRMAAALLAELSRLGQLPERYAILEVSADLAERQRARLQQLPAELAERVVWLERLPVALRGVILANEVADALPCRRISCRDGLVQELGVALAPGGGFRDQSAPADAPLKRAWDEISAQLESLPPRYVSEICLRLEPWLGSLADALERGLILLCDYGLPRRHYYHPQRSAGTLRCHFRHLAHEDPYINIGLQDITAWVDFTRVAEAASAAALTVQGFATQAACLLSLGIEALLAESPDARTRVRLAAEARRLLLPEEMGEAFKMMALTRALDEPLAAFALQDLRYLL
jgi:SAM-dependent MidA family methyltransferase